VLTDIPAQSSVSALTVYPTRVALDGARDEQRLGVLGQLPDGSQKELTRLARFTSANPAIATVTAAGLVQPVGDGETTITVQANNQSAQVPVKVVKAMGDSLVSFSREVVPVLTRMGCNQGACHGSQHGKGGFRLSLRGFDPVFDHSQIVQSAEGRRVVLSDPERSILLLKPTLTLDHGGGERFAVHSREYEVLKRWLEDGAPEPTVKDPFVTGLEVWPVKRILVPHERQQILVRAAWSDGRSEDVTPTAQFDSLNEGVATVTPGGLITAKARGETHIMVRFGGQATVMQVTSPYAHLKSPQVFPANNFVDTKLAAKWRDLGLVPSGLCSDEEFLRRVYLDTIGTLPAPDEVKKFLAEKSPDKRRQAIDRVLTRPEFIDFWALKWGDLLKINRESLEQRGMWSFHNWVRAQIRDNRPVDAMVRDIITAEGSTFTEGPANFYLTANSPADWSETATQIFLGVRIGCAKCHQHPFEKWSQEDYAGMSAFFVRLGTKRSEEFGLFGGERVIYLKNAGEQYHQRKGYLVKPHPLDGPVMDDPLDRRVQLAKWLTAPENPLFARNMVNRFWGYLMGRGLVEPLDDMRATNPASNPELLDALAQDFVTHKYDLKHLLRTILNSRAYQLSARMTDGNKADGGNVHYTRFTVRRLTAEQLADAIDFATATQTKYPGLPLGTRAIALPDAEAKSFLLEVFGKPARRITCECERTMQPNIAQALHLISGEFLAPKFNDVKGRVTKLFAQKKKLSEIIEELYLVTISRPPRPEELDRAVRWVNAAPNPREGVQDLLWTLLNSREFLFNH
jgi:hypothetical protein